MPRSNRTRRWLDLIAELAAELGSERQALDRLETDHSYPVQLRKQPHRNVGTSVFERAERVLNLDPAFWTSASGQSYKSFVRRRRAAPSERVGPDKEIEIPAALTEMFEHRPDLRLLVDEQLLADLVLTAGRNGVHFREWTDWQRVVESFVAGRPSAINEAKRRGRPSKPR